MVFADVFYGPSKKDDTYSNVKDARRSILRVDYLSITDSNDARRREVAPFPDTGMKRSPARDNCAFWPVPPTRKPGPPQTSGLPPVLVIATTKSPIVGYESGKNDCVDRVGVKYLTDLELPAEGARCQEAS